MIVDLDKTKPAYAYELPGPMTETLVGKYFCTNEHGHLGFRGRILLEPSAGLFLVEFSSWAQWDGDYDRHQCLQQVKDMMNWVFFDSEEALDKHVEGYIGAVGYEWMEDADNYFR